MYESTAILKPKVVTVDSVGNNVISYPPAMAREVYVVPRSIGLREFYEAATAGLKPSLTLVLANYKDYEGEDVVEYEGREYTITRTYRTNDRLELTIEERKING